MSSTYIPNPPLLCEEVLATYISSSLANTGLIDPASTFYTGTDNIDKIAPACIVTCNRASETYWQSRVYRFNVDVTTKQMAADSSLDASLTSSMLNFGGNIYALFGDSYTASSGINTMMYSSSNNNFHVLQTQVTSFDQQRIDDSWISNLALDVIGLIPNPTQL